MTKLEQEAEDTESKFEFNINAHPDYCVADYQDEIELLEEKALENSQLSK